MDRDCSGCTWISEEIGRRKSLASEFRLKGDERMAAIARDTIDSLVRDWHAHVDRDHVTASNTGLQALSAAVGTESLQPSQDLLPVRETAPEELHLSNLPG